MSDSPNALPVEQPENPVAWHVTVRRMHKWISEPGEKASRPFIVMVTEPEKKEVIKTRIVSDPPDPPAVLEWLDQSLEFSGENIQKRAVPQVIVFDDQLMARALQQALSERQIRSEYQAQPAQAEEAILMFEELIEESAPDFPGLFSVAGFTPEMGRHLFKDIETFYLKQPWKTLSDQQPVALQLKAPEKWAFIQLMGQAGIQIGLNIFHEWAGLLHLLEVTLDPIDQIPTDGLFSLSFENSNMLPGSDLDAIEKYALPVAQAEAYPLPLIYTKDAVQRPSLAELALMHAALLALPDFVHSLVPDQDGFYAPLEADYAVETILGQRLIRLSYPAGENLPAKLKGPDLEMSENEISAGSVDADDLLDDLRMLEASAADQALAEFAEDESLKAAQRLVYRAWRSDEAIERQLLAHQALELSGDCADAYVLLAEEEAETIEEAYRFYRQALEAAERQLSKGQPIESTGSYWEAFRTRPLLRALEGVANTLVELEKPAESLAYFQKMLELDPDDHLGARYGCLHTLMELNDSQTAHNLLHAFPNELSAFWSYTHALISFTQKGETLKVDNTLRWALQQNPFVPAYLLGEKLLPEELPGAYAAGDEDEAVFYASEYFAFWWQVKGAIDWLKRLYT